MYHSGGMCSNCHNSGSCSNDHVGTVSGRYYRSGKRDSIAVVDMVIIVVVAVDVIVVAVEVKL